MPPIVTKPNGVMNLKNAAHYVGVCVETFRRVMRKTKGRPPYYRIGGRYFFRKEELDSWLEGFRNK